MQNMQFVYNRILMSIGVMSLEPDYVTLTSREGWSLYAEHSIFSHGVHGVPII